MICSSYIAIFICKKLLSDPGAACLIPFIILNVAALAFGIVAAVRGSNWWLLLSLCALCLSLQALIALMVE